MNREAASAYLSKQRQANIALARKHADPILWAETVWKIRGDRAQPYHIALYLHEILLQKAPRVVIMSAAGTGKTEAFLTYTLAKAD